MRVITLYIIAVCLAGCTNMQNNQRSFHINVRFPPAAKSVVYLEKRSFTGKQTMLLDSAEISYEADHLEFQVIDSAYSVYQLRLKKNDRKIIFEPSGKELDIVIDDGSWKSYHFTNRGANNAIADFVSIRNRLNDSVIKLSNLKQKGGEADEKEWMEKISNVQRNARNIWLKYADTTTSAAAFLLAYNEIDFGNDFTAAKRIVGSAAQRFSANPEVLELNRQTIRYASIYEKEYNPGGLLPDISLPDFNGNTVRLSSLRGSYVLIDFWSSWCPSCLEFIQVKRDLLKSNEGNKIRLVSIAIDAEKQDCRNIITRYNIPGIQLIDTAMWKGEAAYQSKIDSIPFNFLLDPSGRILAKAIPKDSVRMVVMKYVR